MIRYRHQDFAYENYDEPATEYQTDRAKKDYSRGRSLRSMRKGARGRTGFTGGAITHRRNKRYAA